MKTNDAENELHFYLYDTTDDPISEILKYLYCVLNLLPELSYHHIWNNYLYSVKSSLRHMTFGMVVPHKNDKYSKVTVITSIHSLPTNSIKCKSKRKLSISKNICKQL